MYNKNNMEASLKTFDALKNSQATEQPDKNSNESASEGWVLNCFGFLFHTFIMIAFKKFSTFRFV